MKKNDIYLKLLMIKKDSNKKRNMEFCEICDNLLYLKADEESALIKYCKHCSFSKKETIHGRSAVRVAESLYSEDDLLYLQFQNKYLRYDPTLPRVCDPALACPNGDCSGRIDAEKAGIEYTNQVLYIKYHPIHMKYMYCCDYCGTIWRQDKK